MEIKIIQDSCGSGTSEYGVDDGRLYARGYGELHGRTFTGDTRCRYVYGKWRAVCAERHDWEGAARRGVSLHAYEAARSQGLEHSEALGRAERLSGLDPASDGQAG